MAKGNSRRTPGKGVVPGSIGERVRAAADDLYANADAVVIVAVRFSGSNDSDEQIVRCTRGSRLALSKAMDQLYERDEREAQVYVDDDVDDDAE